MNEKKCVMHRKTNSEELHLISCGYEICEPGQSFGPVTRDYYMLHFVSAGCGHYYSNHKHYLVTKDQCFLTEPGHTTLYHAEDSDPWTYAWICFDGSMVPSLIERCGMDRLSQVISISCAGEIKDLITEMMNHHQLIPSDEWYIQSYLYLIFAKLQENLASLYSTEELSDNDYVFRAIEYIEQHAFEELNVSDVANHLSISRSYLYTLFERELGTSPQQFLTKAKINYGRELLQKTNLPVAEVAAACGYQNPFAFSRAFKQLTNLSPRDYRKIYHKSDDLLNI